jgi:hypothetical protein
MAAGLALFGFAHRKGSTQLLTKAGNLSERVSGIPGWASLPALIAGISLLVAVLGFYADVATHIDNGRDPGPFANPFHYLIIFGLLGIALAGYVSILLGSGDEDPRAVTVGASLLGEGWKVPIGGILLLVCGTIAVLGFPLDDVWHRLFGQDVTLWSPTHMQMVGGASLSTLALWILMTEATRDVSGARRSRSLNLLLSFVAGSFLIGLSAFQAEFDYSVPQFRLLYHPILLLLTAGAALVPARICLGRGGALRSVVVFVGIRGLLTLVIGPVMGHSLPHFPLYIAEALAVEAVALRVSTDRQLTFGAIAGVAIAVFGLPAEWAWSHVWTTIAWPSALLPGAVLFGLLAGVAGGVLGGYIGRALTDSRERQESPAWIAIAMAAGVLLCLAFPFPTDASLDATATVALTPTERAGWVNVDVTTEPADAASDASWFNVTAWQGGGSVLRELVAEGPGTYRANGPVPVTGDWKTLIRFQKGKSALAFPIYLPADPAIPAKGVAATPKRTAAFVADKKIILREAKPVSSTLTVGASIALGAIFLTWVFIMAWGLGRLQPPLPRGAPRTMPTPA